MTPVPWPVVPAPAADAIRRLAGITRAPTPVPPAPPDPEPRPPSVDPVQWAAALVWLPAEDAVLAALADHGGDLTAHRHVHQENR